jgi:guanine nucleotide-binding protein subunit gamma, fungi
MNARAGGRQSMSELKLRRLIEHNQRLREDLARPRMRVSEASARYIALLRPLLSGI